MAPGMSAPPPGEIEAAQLASGWAVECFRCPEHRVSLKFWLAPTGDTERGSGIQPEPLSTLPMHRCLYSAIAGALNRAVAEGGASTGSLGILASAETAAQRSSNVHDEIWVRK